MIEMDDLFPKSVGFGYRKVVDLEIIDAMACRRCGSLVANDNDDSAGIHLEWHRVMEEDPSV